LFDFLDEYIRKFIVHKSYKKVNGEIEVAILCLIIKEGSLDSASPGAFW